MNPEETKDAQVVFGNALRGLADESHAAGFDVRQPADRVVNNAIRRHRQAVDGEVTAHRIARPVAAEGNPGLAPEGFDVFA